MKRLINALVHILLAFICGSIFEKNSTITIIFEVTSILSILLCAIEPILEGYFSVGLVIKKNKLKKEKLIKKYGEFEPKQMDEILEKEEVENEPNQL